LLIKRPRLLPCIKNGKEYSGLFIDADENLSPTPLLEIKTYLFENTV
jgi:hypothetical protein